MNVADEFLLLQNYSFKYNESNTRAAILVSLDGCEKDSPPRILEIMLMCSYTETMCFFFNRGVLANPVVVELFDKIFTDVYKLFKRYISDRLNGGESGNAYCEMIKYAEDKS